MIKIKRYKSKSNEINISPLIDMVFILLIFFVVTTSFVKDSAVEIERPTAKTGKNVKNKSLYLTITKTGKIYYLNNEISFFNISSLIRKALNRESEDLQVVLLIDKKVETGLTIKILDLCKVAGAKNISVATKQ
jgi:biopolymer transport protein ExbD